MQLLAARHFFIFIYFAYFFTIPFQTYAAAFNVRKTFSIRELYSDNINLAPQGNEESALVTEISPGISIFGNSARSRLSLNYRLQGIYNAGGESGFDVNHQLQFNSNYTLVPRRFFIRSSSSISQQNISNNQIATDNFTGSSNSTTISTFSITPYWTPHFSYYADGLVSATYDRVGSGSGQISDTNSFSQNVSLRNGRYFSKLGWNFNFNNRINQNSDGEDISFQDSNLSLRYFLNRKFSLTANFGHSSNDFAETTNFNQNGFFYTFGARWSPSRRLTLAAGWGNNSFVTVSMFPFNRLRMQITYRNNDIGTNTGSVWQGSLNYFTRRSNIGFTYNEDTTTVQQVLLEQQIFVAVDEFGEVVRDPITDQPQLFIRFLPTLTDEVFVRKRGQINYSFRTGKSRWTARAFAERRTFQLNQTNDNVYGVSGTWFWRYSSRLSMVLNSNWQNTDNDLSNSKLFDVSFRVQRNISRNFGGNIEYRYLNQISNDNSLDYDENRISISLFGRF